MNPKTPYASALAAMDKKKLSFRVACQSHIGAENAISKVAISNQIFGKFDPSTDRALRLIHAALNEDGELICTNQDEGGYYYAKNQDEVDEFINRVIQSRINSLATRRDALYQAMYRKFKMSVPTGQASLF
jgi:hypothetical protein